VGMNQPELGEPSDFGVVRLRIAVLAIGFAIVGAAAGGVFNEL